MLSRLILGKKKQDVLRTIKKLSIMNRILEAFLKASGKTRKIQKEDQNSCHLEALFFLLLPKPK